MEPRVSCPCQSASNQYVQMTAVPLLDADAGSKCRPNWLANTRAILPAVSSLQIKITWKQSPASKVTPDLP